MSSRRVGRHPLSSLGLIISPEAEERLNAITYHCDLHLKELRVTLGRSDPELRVLAAHEQLTIMAVLRKLAEDLLTIVAPELARQSDSFEAFDRLTEACFRAIQDHVGAQWDLVVSDASFDPLAHAILSRSRKELLRQMAGESMRKPLLECAKSQVRPVEPEVVSGRQLPHQIIEAYLGTSGGTKTDLFNRAGISRTTLYTVMRAEAWVKDETYHALAKVIDREFPCTAQQLTPSGHLRSRTLLQGRDAVNKLEHS